MTDIALLLSDVDGTLVTQDKVLTPAAIEAVRAVREAGMRFAITSGRPPAGMRMLVEPLGIDTVIGGFNGGVYVNADMSVVAERTLDPAVADEALRLVIDAGLDAWLYTGTEWIIRDPDAPHVAREAFTVQMKPVVVSAFTDAHLAAAAKVVGVSDDYGVVSKTESTAQQTLGARASAATSQPYYLDITHPEANKGAVVLHLSEMLGIPAERIATIGDSANDVLMFKKSGFSIAMGNASDAVKAQANAVTESNEQDGFSKAVRRFILKAEAAP